MIIRPAPGLWVFCHPIRPQGAHFTVIHSAISIGGMGLHRLESGSKPDFQGPPLHLDSAQRLGEELFPECP